MKTRTIIILFLFTILVLGCNVNTESSSINSSRQLEQKTTPTAIDSTYSEDAFKVLDENSILTGSDEIMEFQKDQNEALILIAPIFEARSHPRNNVYYEIQHLRNSASQELKRLLVWRDLDGKRLKEFEYDAFSQSSSTEIDISVIKERREEWMRLCNSHQISNLINNLYSENTIYFNHKPLVIGRMGLVEEYSYMNRPDYKLKLDPIKIEVVNDSTIFEIGQCSGSYKGKYVLVWKKESDGKWRIFIDANV